MSLFRVPFGMSKGEEYTEPEMEDLGADSLC